MTLFMVVPSIKTNHFNKLQTKTLGKDSFLNQVAELVKKAQAQKSNLENMADRVAGYLFTMLHLLLVSFH